MNFRKDVKMGKKLVNKIYICDDKQISSSHFVKLSPETYRSEVPVFDPPENFLYYHIRGIRCFEKGGDNFQLHGGDVALFLKGESYVTPVPETEYEAINIFFSANPTEKLISSSSSFNCTTKYIYIPFIINVRDDLEIKLIFEEIARISVSFHPLRELRSHTLLKQLLITLATRYQFRKDKLIKPVELVIDLIRRNPEKNFKIDELAERLNFSRSSLTKNFKKVTGKSIKNYQLQIKINMAINMMQTDPYIKFRKLSRELGFYDEYHFSKIFKKITGSTPSSYRGKI